MQTELQSVAVGESFTVRLGADPRVTVRYKPAQVQRDSQARTMLVTHKQLIEMHNLHGKAIHITLYEPIPLPLPPDDSKIKVLPLFSMMHVGIKMYTCTNVFVVSYYITDKSLQKGLFLQGERTFILS